MGFGLGIEWKRYRQQNGLATKKSFKDRIYKDTLSVSTKAADSLEENWIGKDQNNARGTQSNCKESQSQEEAE